MQAQNQNYVRPSGTLAMPQNAAEYRQLLTQVLTCMDNETRPLVENTVVRSLRDPQTAFMLVDIINTPTPDDPMSPGIRQLAAVLLRKRVLTLWRGIGLEEQNQLKAILLDQMGNESVRLVRFAIAHVLCVIARVELRDGWPELMDALHAASQAPSAEHRELACVLVHSLARTIADETGDAGKAAATRNVQLAGSVLIAGLQDSEGVVRTAALKAADALVPGLAGKGAVKRSIVEELVPRLMEMVRACGGNNGNGAGEMTRASDVTRLSLRALAILEQLLELHSSKFPHLDAILGLLLETARAADAHLRVREEAAEVLTAVVNARPKLLVKKGAVDALLELGFALVCEGDSVAFEEPQDELEAGGDDEEDYDIGGDRDADDDPLGAEMPRPTSVFGGRLLTAIGDAIASKRVLPFVADRISKIGATSDPYVRKGTLLLAAAVSGGCRGSMRRQADDLLALVKSCMGDAAPLVRAAAGQALMHFSAHLQPEILLNHEQLIPLIGTLMQDADESVRTRGARALAGVCEEMPPDQLDAHISTLVPMVASTLNSGTASQVTQKYLCEVLAAIGDAKSTSLAPFATNLFQLLIPATGPATPTMLRAHALQACGLIAVGAGRSIFTEEVFAALWPNVAEAFASPHPELREMCYAVAAHMATLLGADFGDCALQVVEAALALLNDENTDNIKSSNPLAKSDFKLGDDADLDAGVKGPDNDDADDEPDAQDDYVMLVRTADVEEKTAAVYCLGVFAVELGPNFGPYLQEVTDALEGCVMHMNNQIRVNALHALVEVIRARHISLYAPEQPPAVVKGVEPTDDTLFPAVRDMVDEFIRAEVLPIMNTDTEAPVVAAACDAIVHLTRTLGAVSIHPYLNEILQSTSVLLQQQAPCQNAEEDGDFDSDEGEGNYQGEAIHGPRGGGGDDDDVNEDHDQVLIDSVSEIVDTLCMAYGPSFAPSFQQLAGYLVPYTMDDRSGEDHVFAAGVIAQCLDALGPSKAPMFFDAAYSMATRLVHSTPESVARSNCCLVLNVLIRHVPARFTDLQIREVLAIVWAVLHSNDELPSTHDNAASVGCSLVHTLPNGIPLASVLPELLPRLPMRADREENVNVCRCLASLADVDRARALITANDGTFEAWRDAVRRTMALTDGELAPEHKAELWSTVSAAAAAVPFQLE